MLTCSACVTKHDAPCLFNLIVEEFTEILHIHFAFVDVNNSCKTAKDNVFIENAFSCLYNVGELTHARRLDDDAVGVIGFYGFLKRS